MNTACIIAEYNPLHNGHIYHIDKTVELTNCDAVAVIMSGNFVERGEPAVLDKYTRARHAVMCGADVVVELPALYAISGAKYFADGAIMTLNNIKSARWLSFGTECGDIDILKRIAEVTECDCYDSALVSELKKGLSYPKACENALKSMNIDPILLNCLKSPNNTLGIEYLKALKRRESNVDTVTIERLNNYHSDTLSEPPSATAIRKALNENMDISDYVDESVLSDLINAPKIDSDRLFSVIASKLINNDSEYYEDNEGIVNRIKKTLTTTHNFTDLVNASHTKRYTKSRIRRVLLHIALDHYKSLSGICVEGVNVLAVNRKKIDILSDINITKSRDTLIENNKLADKIYEIITASRLPCHSMQIVDRCVI